MRRAAAATLALGLAACATAPSREELVAAPGPHLAQPLTVTDRRARFREIFCGKLADAAEQTPQATACEDVLWRLADEALPPGEGPPVADYRPQVYLVSGAFGECLGDSAWPFNAAVAPLRAAGYRIETIVVGGRSGPSHNAQQIAERLAAAPSGEQGPAVMIGYSKGVNDILEFLVDHPREAARVLAVVGVAGAVGGSPVADEAAGLYDTLLRHLPDSSCAPGDGQVVDSLRVETRRAWFAANPLPGQVRYYSVVAFAERERVASILVPAWRSLLRSDPRADGQLLARDQLVPGSTLLGYLNVDHWAAAIDVEATHPLLGSRPDKRPFPRQALLEAILLQVAEDGRESGGP